ncbi:hypothetical protein ACB094_04G018900 [Castanea mollissima]
MSVSKEKKKKIKEIKNRKRSENQVLVAGLLCYGRRILDKFSDNQISATVTESDGFQWVLSGFCRWTETQDRYKSWALFSHICSLIDGAWMCIGDFNEMLSSSEKLSCRPALPRQLDAFLAALERCNLVDLGLIGYPFTWNNRRPGLPTPRNG